jgi:hypothetical protein
LAAEKEYYAILQLPECIRLERCGNCFEELRHGTEKMPFHWKVRRNLDGSKNPVLDLESLRALFDRLGEAPDPEAETIEDAAAEVTNGEDAEDAAAAAEDGAQTTAGLRYLVALLLLRKRRLKMVDPKTPEQEAADLLVVDPKIAEMEPVALDAPELDPDRLGNLREELMAALGEETETASAEHES